MNVGKLSVRLSRGVKSPFSDIRQWCWIVVWDRREKFKAVYITFPDRPPYCFFGFFEKYITLLPYRAKGVK